MTVELYNVDCLEFMLRKKIKADGVLTDPPYGIGINNSNRLSISRGFGGDEWDKERAESEVRTLYNRFDMPMIVWGGNYYTDILPPKRGWLIWDKLNDGRDFGEAELAWTNIDSVIRRYKKFPVNMDGGKVHPTQKPIELMVWCLEKMPNSISIFDPFMGSGSVGVACVMLGKNFIGCERDENYFKIAQKRISEAQLQPSLFQATKEEAKQESFL